MPDGDHRWAARMHDILRPELADELESLRAIMTAEAERVEMPGRFTVTALSDRPAFIIRDAETDRTSYVPAYAYAAVRETLADLFGKQEGDLIHDDRINTGPGRGAAAVAAV